MGLSKSLINGKFSSLLAHFTATLNSLPKILVILLVIATFGSKPYLMLLSYGILSAPKLADLLNSRIQALRKEEFIDSSVSIGLSWPQIIFKHIVWYNARYLILSQICYMFAMALIIEASFSYIGIGFDSQNVTWGSMLNEALKYREYKTFFALPWDKKFWLDAFLSIISMTILIFGLFQTSENLDNKNKTNKGIYV